MRAIIPFLIVFLFLGMGLGAQSENLFLSREYWRTNPSIEDIKQKSAGGYDISQLNSNAFDPVVYALLEKADNATIKYMISQEGNDVNKITHDGRTYVFWAAYKGNLEMVRYLLNEGARMDVLDSHGYTVMNFAASTGQLNTKLYELLLNNGANISDLDPRGASALLLSSPYTHDFRLFDFFVSKEADPTFTDAAGNGLFNYAAKGGDLVFLQQLIDRGFNYLNLNKYGGNAVMFAAKGLRGRRNNIEVYQFLEEKGLKINVVGENGRNPLHQIALRDKDAQLFKFFMERGVKADLGDEDGTTPFMLACANNTLEVVSLLRQGVANIKQKNKKGQSALTLAIQRNDPKVCQFLIENGADVSILDADGNSLAFYLLNSYSTAAKEVFDVKLELISKNGFELSESEGKGQTLYHLAVEKNDLDLIKKLKVFELNVNAKNDDGLTPLHLAAMKAHDQNIMKYLIEEGADRSILTDFDESVYDLAAENELLQKAQTDLSFLK